MALDAAQNSLKDHGDAHSVLDLGWLTIVFVYSVNFYVPVSPIKWFNVTVWKVFVWQQEYYSASFLSTVWVIICC